MDHPHNLTYDQQQGVESHAPYMKVFFALLLLTVMEYFYALLLQRHFLALVLGLVLMAGVKAALVAIYFMHLKFEGRWVYLMIIPALCLAAVLVMGLYPDIALRPGPTPRNAPEEEYSSTSPIDSTPGPIHPQPTVTA